MKTGEPNDQTAKTSTRDTPLIELFLPELGWRPAMTGSEYCEFREWWYETALPDILLVGKLIGRL